MAKPKSSRSHKNGNKKKTHYDKKPKKKYNRKKGKKRPTAKAIKAKGRRLQNFVAKRLAEITGLKYGSPGDETADVTGRQMGLGGVDIVLSKEARNVIPWSIEVKNVERFDLWKTVEQAKHNQQDDTEWLVVTKKNRHRPVAIVDFDIFLKMWVTILYGTSEIEYEEEK